VKYNNKTKWRGKDGAKRERWGEERKMRVKGRGAINN
jgi:hypothetical protein